MKSILAQYTPSEIITFIREKNGIFWERERKERALALFHKVAKEVPAYKDFLKKNKIDPATIRTFGDFQRVPPVSKKEYLREYPFKKLHWQGTMERPMVFTATSGSTGEPFYFSRTQELDWQYSILAELFLQNSSYGAKGPTLVLVCFGMGVWIGGIITYKAFEMASQRGYSVSLLAPGLNKDEIFNALKKIAPHFNQTILIGYPPFIKDIIDEAPSRGVNLEKLRMRLLFAAESFGEHFRDYLAKKAGVKDLCRDTLNIYGTADIGAMAFETPTAIFIRRAAMKNKKLFKDLFGQTIKTPTLAQYNPLFITFEALPDEEVLLTGNNAIPLVRYAVGDHGGVLSFNEVAAKLKKYGIDLPKDSYQLPFVYVYERSDFSTTLYGLQIYPEVIKEALLDEILTKHITGKFTMITKFDRKHNQYLEINVELQKGLKESNTLRRLTTDKIFHDLRSKSSEFRELSNYLGKRAAPIIVFWPYEYSLYFKSGIKQKWSKK